MCRPTSSTAGESCARATARAASPDGTPKPNFESSWPVRTNSWVWASTPGVARIRTFGRSPSAGVQGGEALELVEAVDDDATDARLARRLELVDATCCCRGARADRRARPRRGPRGARRRWPRRGASPPRGRAAPSPGRGTPWRRRPPRRRRRPPPRGSGPGGGPRRRRTGACRSARPARGRRSRRCCRRPSSPTVAVSGSRWRGSGPAIGATSPRARTPRAGRGRWPGRCERPRRATGAPG